MLVQDLSLSASSQPPLPPVITIFGSTGTGKTKLSVQLARALSSSTTDTPYTGAEIISCDSMQIYKGLDIITNKATACEMGGVPHHLIGFVDPAADLEGGYDVTQFVADTNRIVSDLAERGQVGVVCGGTTYYLQHLLFPGRLITSSRDEGVDVTLDPLYQSLNGEERELLERVSAGNSGKVDLATAASGDAALSMALWQLLAKVDPPMAARWHHRDARKIANSLRVYKCTGRPHSHLIAEQDSLPAPSAPGASAVSGRRKLLFWLWCDPPVLRDRLDARVDEMVSRGLLAEVAQLRAIAPSPNYQSGIFQTIGYRQFARYLESPEEPGAWASAVDETKTATRQYAKSQLKWVQNKLVPEVRRAQAAGDDVEVFLLDATDVARWDEKVLAPALEVMHRFLAGHELPSPRDVSNAEAAERYLYGGRSENQALTKMGEGDGGEGGRTIEANRLYTCNVCTFHPESPVRVREVDRETHTRGRHHRNNVKRRMSSEEKDRRIRDKVEQGERVRAMREQLKQQQPQSSAQDQE